MVPMLNARIFVTNTHDSDARLFTWRQSSGNSQTWRTRVECWDRYRLHDSDARMRNNSQTFTEICVVVTHPL